MADTRHISRCARVRGRDHDRKRKSDVAIGWLNSSDCKPRIVCGVVQPLVGSRFSKVSGRDGKKAVIYFLRRASGPAARSAWSSPEKLTMVPFAVTEARLSASQLVSLIQPCDSVLLTLDGSGVPWMP
jgi:hypothetical protein